MPPDNMPNPAANPQPAPPLTASALGQALATLAGLGLWFALYGQLHGIAEYLTFSVLGLEPGSRLGEAVLFFFYDTPKVLMLLLQAPGAVVPTRAPAPKTIFVGPK